MDYCGNLKFLLFVLTTISFEADPAAVNGRGLIVFVECGCLAD